MKVWMMLSGGCRVTPSAGAIWAGFVERGIYRLRLLESGAELACEMSSQNPSAFSALYSTVSSRGCKMILLLSDENAKGWKHSLLADLRRALSDCISGPL
jgi:hypothetical protein